MTTGVNYNNAELAKIWERVCAKFSFNHGTAVFNSWVKPLEISGFDAGVITLRSPSRFVKDWVKSNFSEQLENLLRQEISDFLGFDIVVDSKKQVVATDLHVEAIEIKRDDAVIVNNNVQPSLNGTLDNRFKFDNFVIGDTNNFAFTCAKAIAEGKNLGSNTLFIYGGVGSGKTHLLQSVSHYVKEHNPEKKALYLSAERFMFQFVKAIREKDMVAFKEELRSTDILLIDDIQFICGKANLQEEFIHTFNAIVENGKQIVLSADRAPSDFINIDERIKSRLGWGLVADIKKADRDLRFRILKSKAANINAEISDEVLGFLADNVNTNIRELEGALIKVVAQARLFNNPVTIGFAMDTLKDLLRGVRKELTIEEIKRTVCDKFEIKMSDIDSARRDRNISRPRQIAMYLAKTLTTKSLPEIGRNFGDKNHTTVIHAIKNIEKLKASEPEIDNSLAELTRMLAG